MTKAKTPATAQPTGQAPAASAASAAQPAKKASTEIPRYRLTAACYLDDVYYDPENKPFKKDDAGQNTDERIPAHVNFTGIPGPYMVPLNEAARAMFKKYDPQHVDPIGDLTVVGPGGADMKKILEAAEARG